MSPKISLFFYEKHLVSRPFEEFGAIQLPPFQKDTEKLKFKKLKLYWLKIYWKWNMNQLNAQCQESVLLNRDTGM